jgi:hypothetical protein
MNKRTFGVVLLVVCMSLIAICSAETPDLTGTWVGPAVGHHEERGIIEGPEDAVILNVTNQTDRIFTGEIKIMNKDGSYRSENFAGMIEIGGAEFMIIEHDEGFSMGDILSPDEIELIYMENAEGDNPAIIASNHLFRKPAEK